MTVTVDATINYIAAGAHCPRVYYIEPPAGEPASTLEIDPRRMALRNMRGHERAFDLARDGLAFLNRRFAIADLADDAGIRAHAYPQAEALAREITGASHVVAFDHGIRRRDNGVDTGTGLRRGGVQRNIADFAHNDYVPYSAELRVKWFLGDQAERLLMKRFEIFNFWWPLTGPLHDHPLALCVSGTAPEHYVPIENVFERGPNPIAGLLHDPAHRWIYFGGMMPDEMLMFRTWDSYRAMASCVPHVACDAPHALPQVLPRESMELRVIVFHER